MSRLSDALKMMDKATPGPWEIGKNHRDTVIADSKYSCTERQSGHDDIEYYGGLCVAESILPENREVIAAAPDMAAWIKKALPLLSDARCGIDNAFGEGSKISASISALVAEAK